jgi:ATP-dependent Clp protease ATP-binding subunit ClpA
VFSQELEAVLHGCFVDARNASHPTLTVDHLILAMLDSPGVADFLASDSVAIEALRSKVQSKVSQLSCSKDEQIGETDPTLEFQRAIQQVIDTMRNEGRDEVNVVDVLASASIQLRVEHGGSVCFA